MPHLMPLQPAICIAVFFGLTACARAQPLTANETGYHYLPIGSAGSIIGIDSTSQERNFLILRIPPRSIFRLDLDASFDGQLSRLRIWGNSGGNVPTGSGYAYSYTQSQVGTNPEMQNDSGGWFFDSQWVYLGFLQPGLLESSASLSTDLKSSVATLTNNQPSNAPYFIVEFYGLNTSNASASMSATYSVHAIPEPDTSPPVITPIIAGTLGLDGWYASAVSVAWKVIDNESPATPVTGCDPTQLTSDTAGTTLTCSATSAGGTSSSAVTIKIDTTPPTINCAVSPTMLWPPNDKLINISATVGATDALSGTDGYTLASVTSNELDSGTDNKDVPNDIQGWTLGAADVAGQLRAERSGAGAGRVYTLSYRSMDAAGNIARCSTTVSVPHDQRK